MRAIAGLLLTTLLLSAGACGGSSPATVTLDATGAALFAVDIDRGGLEALPPGIVDVEVESTLTIGRVCVSSGLFQVAAWRTTASAGDRFVGCGPAPTEPTASVTVRSTDGESLYVWLSGEADEGTEVELTVAEGEHDLFVFAAGQVNRRMARRTVRVPGDAVVEFSSSDLHEYATVTVQADDAAYPTPGNTSSGLRPARGGMLYIDASSSEYIAVPPIEALDPRDVVEVRIPGGVGWAARELDRDALAAVGDEPVIVPRPYVPGNEGRVREGMAARVFTSPTPVRWGELLVTQNNVVHAVAVDEGWTAARGPLEALELPPLSQLDGWDPAWALSGSMPSQSSFAFVFEIGDGTIGVVQVESVP